MILKKIKTYLFYVKKLFLFKRNLFIIEKKKEGAYLCQIF